MIRKLLIRSILLVDHEIQLNDRHKSVFYMKTGRYSLNVKRENI